MTKQEAKEIWEANRPHMEQEIINFYPTGNVFIGMTGDDMEKLDEYFAEADDSYWRQEAPTDDGLYLGVYRSVHDGLLKYIATGVYSLSYYERLYNILAWHKIQPWKEEI